MDIPDKWKRFLDSLLERAGIERDGVRVRVMTPADVREVVRIVKLHDSDDARAARDYFASRSLDQPYESACHFVLVDPEAERSDGGTGRVVGVSGYSADGGGEAIGVYWLGWTYVNPYFRGNGYGARLMHVVLEHVRRMGARKLFLTTSSLPKFAAAVGFYERFGFREEGRLRDYYRDGEDQILMGLRV